ncbi:hypothetical protein CEXT_223381 [Caerostris extrusa]|uniref:Uncharacterized protein n=1 Tax=Caerostris extrusa TaxID=172846 RepID=A0AAV4YDM0_CAEEX|nr:hypothetical protein CEXT_223381 [Caerostris extrusa]
MRAQIIIFLAVAVLYCESTYYGVNYGLGGANYAFGGPNYAVGAPTGAVNYVVGGAGVPVGGVNYAVGGANYPVGGASFVLGGANYGALGLGYSGLGNAIKVPVGYGTAGLPYSTVSVIKAPVVNSAPLDIGSYAVVNDVLDWIWIQLGCLQLCREEMKLEIKLKLFDTVT